MCDPSCALGNDRAAGISFIHEQLSTMIHLLHLLLPIHQDVFSCSGAYTFCTAFYFQFWCHTCGLCLVISELDLGDTNVRASNRLAKLSIVQPQHMQSPIQNLLNAPLLRMCWPSGPDAHTPGRGSPHVGGQEDQNKPHHRLN